MTALKLWAWVIIGLLLLGMMGTRERSVFWWSLAVVLAGLGALWLGDRPIF
jgi:hypothetical protein